jgi:hypothetical protein
MFTKEQQKYYRKGESNMVLTDLIAELIEIVNLMYNSLMDWINTYFK